MLAFDVHQHLWPEGVLTALSQRTEAPFARWTGDAWTVVLAGEPAFTIDPADHEPEQRGEAVIELGLDRALVALSSAVGIESLPAAEAEPILTAWHEETATLHGALQPWAVTLLKADAADQVAFADVQLDAGAAGVCIPAGALTSPAAIARLGELLARLEDRLVPLFVHPGPAGGSTSAAAWWGPATSYVAELHAAWHAFAAWGRSAHPRLHVVFAALAGLAPLHLERTGGRGGPGDETGLDALTFYDTSSYGPRAKRSMAATVGRGQLVHGSDHPVLPARRSGEDRDVCIHSDNPARLLGLTWAVA